MTWRSRQQDILEEIGDEAEIREIDSELYTDESLGYMKSFLEAISETYGELELVPTSEESMIYDHPDGRHVWATYGNDSVKLKGDETTVDRSEEILTSENPTTAYARNRAVEGGSKVSSALANFGGLFD